MNLTQLSNSCTCMYASNINTSLDMGEEGIARAQKAISAAIASKRMWALMATANTDQQRQFLRDLGFKRLTIYESYDHDRDVYVYMRKTTRKEFESKQAYFK